MEYILMGSLILNIVLMLLLDRETEDHLKTLNDFRDYINLVAEERVQFIERLKQED